MSDSFINTPWLSGILVTMVIWSWLYPRYHGYLVCNLHSFASTILLLIMGIWLHQLAQLIQFGNRTSWLPWLPCCFILGYHGYRECIYRLFLFPNILFLLVSWLSPITWVKHLGYHAVLLFICRLPWLPCMNDIICSFCKYRGYHCNLALQGSLINTLWLAIICYVLKRFIIVKKISWKKFFK